MSKPIQIVVTHTRMEMEQWGQVREYVLLDDGRIFFQELGSQPWTQLEGPWMNEGGQAT